MKTPVISTTRDDVKCRRTCQPPEVRGSGSELRQVERNNWGMEAVINDAKSTAVSIFLSVSAVVSLCCGLASSVLSDTDRFETTVERFSGSSGM